MQLIECPWCGPREETEFHYGGQAHVAKPRQADAYLPGNVAERAVEHDFAVGGLQGHAEHHVIAGEHTGGNGHGVEVIVHAAIRVEA